MYKVQLRSKVFSLPCIEIELVATRANDTGSLFTYASRSNGGTIRGHENTWLSEKAREATKKYTPELLGGVPLVLAVLNLSHTSMGDSAIYGGQFLRIDKETDNLGLAGPPSNSHEEGPALQRSREPRRCRITRAPGGRKSGPDRRGSRRNEAEASLAVQGEAQRRRRVGAAGPTGHIPEGIGPSQLIRGERSPSPRVQLRLQQALGVTGR